MDVADMDALMGAMQSGGGGRGDGARRRVAETLVILVEA